MGWASLGRRLSRYVRSELGSRGRRLRSQARRVSGPDPEAQDSGQDPTSSDDESRISAYYANLEIPNGSDFETVKSAYRELMRRYHPDKHAGKSEDELRVANELAGKLTEAYEALERHLGEAG